MYCLETTNPLVYFEEETDTSYHRSQRYKAVWLKRCCLNEIDWFEKARRNYDNCVKWKESEVNIYRHSFSLFRFIWYVFLNVSYYYNFKWIGWLTNSISITIKFNAQRQCDWITVDQWALNTENWIRSPGIRYHTKTTPEANQELLMWNISIVCIDHGRLREVRNLSMLEIEIYQ